MSSLSITYGQARTTRSLTELMFGRTVSGPLQLVKSAWLQETDLSTAKQNVVEFIPKCSRAALPSPRSCQHA